MESDALSTFFQQVKQWNFEQAEAFAQNLQDQDLKKEMIQLTRVLFAAGQLDVQINDTTTSTDKRVQLISYLSRGYYHLYTNPYGDKPFRFFNKAYALSKEIESVAAEKFSLVSILEVYNFEIAQSNDDAVLFFNRYKALISDNEDQYHYLMNVLHFNLRDIFLNITIDLSFFTAFDKVMSRYQSTHRFWPNYYSSKGVFFEAIGREEEAAELHQKAISSINDEPFLKFIDFRSNIRLSEINRKLARYNEALNYIDIAFKSIDKADTTRSNYYIHFYLSKIYDESGQFDQAYSNLLKATDLKNKLEYERNSLEIARLNVRYQTQEKELALLREREKVRGIQNLLIGAVFIIIFISITYYLIQKNTKRKQLLIVKEKDLERQKVVTLLKEQELVSIDAMVTGQEKERQRLANELHDDLGGLLASIKLHFHTLTGAEHSESNQLFVKTDALINEAYDKVRAIAHAKNSGVIAKEGLLKSVEAMAKKVSIANNLMVTVNEHGLDDRLENATEIALFRIIQELITNTIRHANASEANIHLTRHNDYLNIMVEDNGDGFDTNGITLKADGMGIKSIDKRVAFLGGTMNIESERGQGSTVIIEIPL
ncbi:MAG: signal transduction histidine kinase [Roseivirga sp.]